MCFTKPNPIPGFESLFKHFEATEVSKGLTRDLYQTPMLIVWQFAAIFQLFVIFYDKCVNTVNSVIPSFLQNFWSQEIS